MEASICGTDKHCWPAALRRSRLIQTAQWCSTAPCRRQRISREFSFVRATLGNQRHKSAPVISNSFSVVAVESYTASIQYANNLVENIFRSFNAKTTSSRTNPNSKGPHALYDHSYILDLPTYRHSRTFASHGSTFKKSGTGCTAAKFNSSSTPLRNVQYHRALVCLELR